MGRGRSAGGTIGIIQDLLLQLPLVVLRLAEDQAQLPVVLIFQGFTHQRAHGAQVFGQGRLLAHSKLATTSLTIEPLRLEALDGIHHIAVDVLQAHAPVQNEGSVVKATAIKKNEVRKFLSESSRS